MTSRATDHELPDVTGSRFLIVGMSGEGKTKLAQHFLGQHEYEKTFTYDARGEYDATICRAYVPADMYDVDEFAAAISYYVEEPAPAEDGTPALDDPDRPAPSIVVLDEANLYMPKQGRLPTPVRGLVNLARHWEVAFGAVCLRPAQLHTDITENAKYTFIFYLEGRNDLSWCEERRKGLSRMVSRLEPHQFIVLEPRKRPWIHDKLDIGA